MAEDKGALRSWIAATGALAFHALNGLVAASMIGFPSALDELQQLSFIRWMERAPRLFPRYEDMRVLDVGGVQFTAAFNYLNHPSPYYLLMASLDRALGGSILAMRLVNLGLSLCAVALILAAGFRVLGGWKERAVFAAAVVLFPKLGVVGGLINNDNAALLAAGLAFLGLIEWQRAPSGRTAFLLGLGVALCGWTKLTVLVMAGFSVLIGEGLRLWTTKERPRPHAYGILAAGFLLAAGPSLANMVVYGRILHHPQAYHVPRQLRASLDMAGYAAVFLRDMADKWSALEPSGFLGYGLYLVLGLGAAAVVVGWRRMRRADGDPDAGAAWRAACAMILAIPPVLLLHLYFGWRTFVEDGFVGMAHPRYYYGLWPGFALGAALLWRTFPERWFRAPLMIVSTSLLVCSSLAFLGLVPLVHGRTSIH